MTVLLGAAPSIIGPSEVGAWMASKGAAGAAALLDFASQKYGFCNAAGVPRWGSIPADLTYTRASAAGRWPAAGPYEMVGSGVLRYEHDPVTRAPVGVRIESAASPLSVNTANIAAWPGATASNITRPSIFAGGVAVEHVAPSSGFRSQQYTLAASTSCRLDAILERGVGTDAPPNFLMGIYRTAWVSAAYYNWTTDTLSLGPGPTAQASSGYVVEQLGTGPSGGKMVRLSCVVQSGDGGSTGFFFYPTGSFGSVAGQSAIVHYACCTPGVVYQSPMIIGATAAARAADSLRLVVPFDAREEGITIAAIGRLPRGPNPSSSNLFVFGTSTFAPRLGCYSFAAGNAAVFSTGSPAPFVSGISANGLPVGQPVRAVLSATPDGTYRMSLNGGAVTTRAGNRLEAGSSYLDIGNLFANYGWGDAVEKIAVWRGTPHSDAALRGLLA